MSNMSSRITQKGFTIIELVIVVVVIAILATVAVVAYNGTQNKAHDATVRSDMDSTSGLLENFRVAASNSGHLFPQDTTELAKVGVEVTKPSYRLTRSSNFVYCVDESNFQSYALVAESKSGAILVETQDGFKSTAITGSDFSDADSICSSLDMSLVSSGMSAPNTWQTWVNN
jgi:prepilin-type N-terminal cleavage/methylation domain-containing protein